MSANFQAIGVAVSDRPAGPFHPAGDGPLVCQIGEGGSIDPSTFVDRTGTRYLVWKNDGNSCGRPTWVTIQPLSADGLALAGEGQRLIVADQATVDQAQAAFDSKDYSNAVAKAEEALRKRTNDPAATKLKNDAQEQIRLAQTAQDQERKYQAAMGEGQAAFTAKEYIKALAKAEE